MQSYCQALSRPVLDLARENQISCRAVDAMRAPLRAPCSPSVSVGSTPSLAARLVRTTPRTNCWRVDATLFLHHHLVLFSQDVLLHSTSLTHVHASPLGLMDGQDILTRRRNGFGIYWLAATLGSKGTSFRKLSKKEVLGCDLVGAWFVSLLPLGRLDWVGGPWMHARVD